VAGRELHDGLLPARTPALVPAHPLELPLYEEVRTSLTFTLKTRSTAMRISTLLASGCTWNVTTLPSSF